MIPIEEPKYDREVDLLFFIAKDDGKKIRMLTGKELDERSELEKLTITPYSIDQLGLEDKLFYLCLNHFCNGPHKCGLLGEEQETSIVNLTKNGCLKKDGRKLPRVNCLYLESLEGTTYKLMLGCKK